MTREKLKSILNTMWFLLIGLLIVSFVADVWITDYWINKVEVSITILILSIFIVYWVHCYK